MLCVRWLFFRTSAVTKCWRFSIGYLETFLLCYAFYAVLLWSPICMAWHVLLSSHQARASIGMLMWVCQRPIYQAEASCMTWSPPSEEQSCFFVSENKAVPCDVSCSDWDVRPRALTPDHHPTQLSPIHSNDVHCNVLVTGYFVT